MIYGTFGKPARCWRPPVQAAAPKCRKCSYPLRYVYGRHWCDFCRAYRDKANYGAPLGQRIQQIERNLREKVENFLSGPKRPSYYLQPNLASHSRAMLRCSYCGSTIAPSDRVCSQCGRTLAPMTTSTFTYTQPVSSPAPTVGYQPSTDDRVYGYIVDNAGTISLSRAAEDLALTSEELAASIARLKASSRLSEATT